jgi:UDP-glucose 4-epimerase
LALLCRLEILASLDCLPRFSKADSIRTFYKKGVEMKVLVTGGAGYIGSHVAHWLRTQGYEPVVFDDLSTGHKISVKGPFFEGDLCNKESVQAAFKVHAPQAVMHFAAKSLVGESMSDPRKYFHDNIIGALNLLDVMMENSVNAIIFSSTAATYGNPAEIPITENCPQIPINPYGDSKLTIERMLAAYDKAYGLRFAALRYFNAAGAAPEAGLGEMHDPETHLIPIILQVPQGKRSHISIFGDDYDTEDGTCIRDYIHVLDLADAHQKALEKLVAGSDSLQLNLGTGAGNSVREVIDVARTVTGHEIPAKLADRRPGDPDILVAKADKARELLDWNPSRTLSDMIASAWQFYSEQSKSA